LGFVSSYTITAYSYKLLTVGVDGGNQQFSAQRMTFNGCKTAVSINWDWGWVWKSLIINDADVGVRLVNEDGEARIGSVAIMDSQFKGIRSSAILLGISPSDQLSSGSTGLVLDNVNIEGPIVDTAGRKILNTGYYRNFAIGPTYQNGTRKWTLGEVKEYVREKTLLGQEVSGLKVAPYLERPRNQYTDKLRSDFVHIKELGAKGDGSSDDTAAVQRAFTRYGDGSKIIYVDAGTYLLTDTVTIPKDAKIVGETWSQFAATGSKFSDSR
jgi:hypothetical protein